VQPLRRLLLVLSLISFSLLVGACVVPHVTPIQQTPSIPWPSAWPSPFPAPPTQTPGSALPSSSRPLLLPLLGPQAWQAEVRLVIQEIVSNLSPENAAKVRNIPLVIDPNQGDVNAFAGCDDQGSPFIAATEGLLDAIDAISQTQANDDLYGTHTYDLYTGTVLPHLAQGKGSSAALPLGILPLTTALSPARLSLAHDLFDEIVAFTFGHELSHHYLGHTGCARGQAPSGGPNVAALGVMLTHALPGLNQPNEIAADTAGCLNTLDSGRARRPKYVWTERGGLTLLDFFARLERASGLSPLNPVGFLLSHPNPAIRIPIVKAVAQTWRFQHPG
jgi:hypothetical protein